MTILRFTLAALIIGPAFIALGAAFGVILLFLFV